MLYNYFNISELTMVKVELESLEENGVLKGQDMAEAFKTPEGKTQCSKHLGRFGLIICILKCFFLY